MFNQIYITMKKLFLLLAAVGMIFTACTPGGGLDDDTNTEQPGGGNQGEEPIFITDNESDIVVEAKGGTVIVTVSTNLEYSVVIPEEAQSWLSVADTRAIRMEKLTFTIAKNEADAERSAVVKLLGSDNAELQSLSFVQKGASAEEEIPADKTQAIKFQDENTKLLCTLHWDENEDGELSYEEAAAVTDLGTAFKGSSILAFTELKYFTSLEKIADNAFEGCVSLVKITLPEQITTIGTSAFNGCTNLKKIAIPNAVTEIGGNAFNGCTSLTSVDISDLSAWCKIDFGGVSANPLRNGAKLYLNGSELTDITIPSDITKIKDLAFSGCTSLTSITIPDSVTSIGGSVFSSCTSLTSITIPDSVTSIGGSVFSSCTSLTSVTIPDSVTSIGGWAFSGCSSLTSVTIGNGVTSIEENTFYVCRNLTNVTIGDSVTTIRYHAFNNCSSLTSITISDRCSVTEIEHWAFYDCNITDTYVNIGDLAAYAINNNTHCVPGGNKHLLVDGAEITELVIPIGVKSIGESAFSGCSSLTSITIPDSVTSIGSSAFSGCTCELTVNCNIPSASSYDKGAFHDSKFTKVTIGDSVTSIGDYAFYGCTSLTSVTIGNAVTEIGGNAFNGCTSLTRIDITDLSAWCKIGFGDVANPLYCGAKLYLNGSELTEITIPSDITEIKKNAFQGYSSLTSVTIHNRVTKIGQAAFQHCSSLTSITIPDSVTSIEYQAFSGCTSLTSVIIGNSVTSIGVDAFSDCTSLKEVYCKPTTPPSIYLYRILNGIWYNYGSFPFNSGMKIYVPRDSYDAYMQYSSYSNGNVAQTNWYMYEKYIEPYDFE